MKTFFRKLHVLRVVALCGLTPLSFSCGDPATELPVSSKTSYHACAGQKNMVATAYHDYLGASEETWSLGMTGHAAAAELLYSSAQYPPNEIFAVAWVRRADRLVRVRRYSTATKSFQGPEVELSPWSNPAWVRSLGFDEDCAAETGASQSCGWFVFDDDYGWVNWRAVGANGAMSLPRWVPGRYGSGESATVCTAWWGEWCVQWTRKKLLAWISTSQTEVKFQLLADNGAQIGSEQILATTPTNRKFHQTAVAWSSNENRWLVVWSDSRSSASQPMGNAFATYVTFDGVPSGIVKVLGPCDEYSCTGNGPAVGSPNSILTNEYGTCKGFWLASSYYSTATDRYRYHSYGYQVRIDANGAPLSDGGGNPICWAPGCSVYCPITEASLYYERHLTPFQMLQGVTGPSRTIHRRLRVDAYQQYDSTTVVDSPWSLPQGFRSNGAVAAALATDKSRMDPGSTDLVLSIVDVRYDPIVCPPAP